MAVVDIDVVERREFAGGKQFGDVGRYEVLWCQAQVLLDPEAPVNAAIADIASAQRTTDGAVSVSSRVLLLQPQHAERGNRGLLVVIPNRGGTSGVPFCIGSRPALGTDTELGYGDGWALRQGWTIAWVGWQHDVPDHLIGCSVPAVVGADGAPLRGTATLELQPPAPVSHIALKPVGAPGDVSYPAADPDEETATLSWSAGRGRPRTVVPRDQWAFAELKDGVPVAHTESLWVAGGLSPDRVYQLRYTTDTCPLVGGGLAAVREVVTALRQRLTTVDCAIGAGWSQSGRFLREFLAAGMNHDESGRVVFDGVLPVIAGASSGQFNQRYGQPSDGGSLDTAGGPWDFDGLLARDRSHGTAPKVIAINSASEYWRGDASLVHIGPDGDVRHADPHTRVYAYAGAAHMSGAPTGSGQLGDGVANANFLDVTTLSRAVLELLRTWIVDGAEPPTSRIPTIDQGTAVSRRTVLETAAALPITPLPESDDFPTRGATSAAVRVSAVDVDGNEIAGVRHPEVMVPLATHTGWTPLAALGPRWEPAALLIGASLPFPWDDQARAETGDPRPAIITTFPTVSAYQEAVRAAAESLAADRFLLPDDVDVVVQQAAEHYLMVQRLYEQIPRNSRRD